MSDNKTKNSISAAESEQTHCILNHSTGVDPHRHQRHLELLFFVKGNCSFVLSGEKMDVERGTLIAVSHTDYHSHQMQKPNDSYSFYAAHIDESLLAPDMVSRFHRIAGHKIVCRNEQDFQALQYEYALLQNEVNRNADAKERDILIQNIFSRLIILASRIYLESHPPEDTPKELRPALAYINCYFQYPISLEEVASHIGLSQYQFSRMFHARCGVTFQEYVLEKRLNMAYNLVQSTDEPVSRIAEDVCIKSRSYFTRKFKDRYGITPHELRKQHSSA